MKIETLIHKLSSDLDEESPIVSDELARVGGSEVLDAMVDMLKHPNPESRYMAARTLGLMNDNESALEPLMASLEDKENQGQVGDLLLTLEGYDISAIYVPIFKFYLFGNFKVSTVAKDLLDHQDFDITPRVIKKARKHWNHFTNNVKHDDLFEIKKREVESLLADLEDFVNS